MLQPQTYTFAKSIQYTQLCPAARFIHLFVTVLMEMSSLSPTGWPESMLMSEL